MLRLISIFLLGIAFSGNLIAGDYNSNDAYDNGQNYPQPTDYLCTIKVKVSVNEDYENNRDARDRCEAINKIWSEPRCRVIRDSRHKYSVSFDKEWTFEGNGVNWQDSRWIALDAYLEFAYDFGFGKDFPHSLTFSHCGE